MSPERCPGSASADDRGGWSPGAEWKLWVGDDERAAWPAGAPGSAAARRIEPVATVNEKLSTVAPGSPEAVPAAGERQSRGHADLLAGGERVVRDEGRAAPSGSATSARVARRCSSR